MADPDRQAWLRQALDRFEAPLLRYAAHLTGNADLARDIVQDTFLRACRESPGALDSHAAAWLFAVCRHRAIDVRRKERRMKPMALTEMDPPSAPDCPANAVEGRDSAAH